MPVVRNRSTVAGHGQVTTNVDMLKWFSDDERRVCGSCGEKACVSLPAALASFCLACGAIVLDGRRIDVDGRIPT
jgi:hypothetical protein